MKIQLARLFALSLLLTLSSPARAAAPAPDPSAQATRVEDLSGWITAGALYSLVVNPVVRADQHARPTTVSATAQGPGFFVGILPGRGRMAGGVLFSYLPEVAFEGGRVGLWYLDFQGHFLPSAQVPVSVFGGLHAGSLSWTTGTYSDHEFTAGLGLGVRFSPLRHLSLVGEYRTTGLFHGTESRTCYNGDCSMSSSDGSRYMHLFSAGLAVSWF